MKVAFDIHGVADTFPVFQEMIRKYIADPDVEVYIVTGLTEDKAEEQIGHVVDLSKIDGYFSIADCLIARDDVEVEFIDGLPWAEEKAWNNAKADYCYRKGIDILFDDSPVYGPTFDNIDTLYVQVINPNRKRFKTRPDTK